MTKNMSTERLEHILAAYGANPARWPSAEREAALALLRTKPRLEAAHRQAQDLDGLLDQATMPQPSAAYLARIAAMSETPLWRQWAELVWPFGPIWQPAMGLAIAALVGAVSGYALVAPDEIAQITYEIEGLILG